MYVCMYVYMYVCISIGGPSVRASTAGGLRTRDDSTMRAKPTFVRSHSRANTMTFQKQEIVEPKLTADRANCARILLENITKTLLSSNESSQQAAQFHHVLSEFQFLVFCDNFSPQLSRQLKFIESGGIKPGLPYYIILEKLLDYHEAQIANLTTAASQAKKNAAAAVVELQTAHTQVVERDDKLKVLREENAAQRSRIESSNKLNDHLHDDVKALQRKIASLHAELEELQRLKTDHEERDIRFTEAYASVVRQREIAEQQTFLINQQKEVFLKERDEAIAEKKLLEGVIEGLNEHTRELFRQMASMSAVYSSLYTQYNILSKSGVGTNKSNFTPLSPAAAASANIFKSSDGEGVESALSRSVSGTPPWRKNLVNSAPSPAAYEAEIQARKKAVQEGFRIAAAQKEREKEREKEKEKEREREKQLERERALSPTLLLSPNGNAENQSSSRTHHRDDPTCESRPAELNQHPVQVDEDHHHHSNSLMSPKSGQGSTVETVTVKPVDSPLIVTSPKHNVNTTPVAIFEPVKQPPVPSLTSSSQHRTAEISKEISKEGSKQGSKRDLLSTVVSTPNLLVDNITNHRPTTVEKKMLSANNNMYRSASAVILPSVSRTMHSPPSLIHPSDQLAVTRSMPSPPSSTIGSTQASVESQERVLAALYDAPSAATTSSATVARYANIYKMQSLSLNSLKLPAAPTISAISETKLVMKSTVTAAPKVLSKLQSSSALTRNGLIAPLERSERMEQKSSPSQASAVSRARSKLAKEVAHELNQEDDSTVSVSVGAEESQDGGIDPQSNKKHKRKRMLPWLKDISLRTIGLTAKDLY
eukprot:GILJ01007129.1.p1 GENE.GILJ01007129.1~~GILJ01007129.1.p1  ORF type:complete len:823 (-),score=158.84 GILJ01007129.1:141-2609(-)